MAGPASKAGTAYGKGADEKGDPVLLESWCWCGSQTVWVPAGMVRQGETLPCRFAKCRALGAW